MPRRSISLAAAALVAGAVAGGAFAVRRRSPEARGRRLFAAHCARCHVLAGLGEAKTSTAPRLDRWSTPPWIGAVLHDPDAPDLFGQSCYRGGMHAVDAVVEGEPPMLHDAEEARAVAAFLAAQGDEPGDPTPPAPAVLAAKGETIVAGQCTECHLYRGEGD